MKNDYKVVGDRVAISLKRKNGAMLEAVIDVEDLSRAKSISGRWYALFSKKTNSFYVRGSTDFVGSSCKKVSLHRFLLQPSAKHYQVDHVNHDGLDNRRNNLRIVTQSQNQQNRLYANQNNKCGIRNVHWHKPLNKWIVQVRNNGKVQHVGLFNNLVAAEKAAVMARKQYSYFT